MTGIPADLRVEVVVVGQLATNCVLLGLKSSKEVLVVDPGADVEKIEAVLHKHKLRPVAVALTHGHFDHFGAAKALMARWDVPCYMHRGDEEYAQRAPAVALEWIGEPVELPDKIDWLSPGPFEAAGLLLKVAHTPGHSPGSVSFILDGLVLPGDVLFYEGVGRWDFFGGNYNELMKSIQEELLSLPEATKVIPGHGPATSVGHEKRHNPYL